MRVMAYKDSAGVLHKTDKECQVAEILLKLPEVVPHLNETNQNYSHPMALTSRSIVWALVKLGYIKLKKDCE